MVVGSAMYGREHMLGSMCVSRCQECSEKPTHVVERYVCASQQLAPSYSIAQGFCIEAIFWKELKHDNVLQLLGLAEITSQDVTSVAFVAPWIDGGDILKYVAKHPNADKVDLVRMSDRIQARH
jgi:hypothetical protein